jgi:UDPglucose 6-dehydrogenase
LINLGRETHEEVPLIAAIKKSNDQHRLWNFQRLQHRLGSLQEKVVAVLGLTYKPGTDTLRRSAAVELCKDLASAGASVRVVDPVVKRLPPDLSGLKLVSDPLEAMAGADAVVVCTEWPEFRRLAWSELAKVLRGRLVLDANGFLRNELKGLAPLEHLSVGS